MLVKPFLSMSLLSIIILVGVSGCDMRFKSEAILSEYIIDLSRSQFITVDFPAIVMPISLPSRRDRQLVLSQFDIGLLDFLSLQQCDVGIVAGKRNSILGKVMTDSQRFLYELDIIRAIESCDVKDEVLSAELNDIAKKKRLELPIVFGNAIINGEEASVFFSLSNGFLPLNYSTENQQDLLNALNRLVAIGENLVDLPTVDGRVFENDLKILMDSEYGGRLLYSLAQLSRYLTSVSNNIVLLSSEVCGSSLTYLKQQFEQHYVKKIQPYMGRINRSAYEVLPLLKRLIDLGVVGDEMKNFLNQFSLISKNSIWHRYQLASQVHAKQWSRLFESCSVSLRSRS
jgi:hypothetical protein